MRLYGADAVRTNFCGAQHIVKQRCLRFRVGMRDRFGSSALVEAGASDYAINVITFLNRLG